MNYISLNVTPITFDTHGETTGSFCPLFTTSLSGAVLPEALVKVGHWCSVFSLMVLCGVVWSGLGGQGLQPQTVQQRKRRHGSGAGFRRDRYQIALSVHSDRKRHMSANICLIACKPRFKRTNAKQESLFKPHLLEYQINCIFWRSV